MTGTAASGVAEPGIGAARNAYLAGADTKAARSDRSRTVERFVVEFVTWTGG